MNEYSLNPDHRILLISAKPAPNGGLHLGHIAGPYLRQDMLRRHYQMRGATVTVIGGTDPVDSFIALRAQQDADRPDGVAQRYYRQIVQDFASYDIHLDAFIDPFAAEYRQRYVDCFANVVQRADAAGKSRKLERSFPVFAANPERGASGAWLCGNCPDCADAVSGYFCENCGAHFDPSEIANPAGRAGNALRFVPMRDRFFEVSDPDALLASLEQCGVAPPLRALVERQFARGRRHVRLTERSDWGIPTGDDDGQCYFGHGLLYGYCRLLGELYMELSGDPVHPFDRASDVTSVNLFGIDNTVSHMVNIQAIGEEMPGWKGFDAFVVNRFYLLEGKKFSTSARHLIWAHELIHTAKADSDAVRFVISATAPSEEQRNLSIVEFRHWYNDVFVGQVQKQVQAAVANLTGQRHAGVPADVAQAFAPYWARACEGHAFPAYRPEQQVALLLEWLERRAALSALGAAHEYSWLVCMLLLLYPIAPRLAGWAWSALGHDAVPSLAAVGNEVSVVGGVRKPVAPISVEELLQAMPETAAALVRQELAA